MIINIMIMKFHLIDSLTKNILSPFHIQCRCREYFLLQNKYFFSISIPNLLTLFCSFFLLVKIWVGV